MGKCWEDAPSVSESCPTHYAMGISDNFFDFNENLKLYGKAET